jgi:site-specific recombinase XerD
MKNKRSKIVDNALQTVEGFEQVFKVIHQNTILQGKSRSTFNNYLRRIAIISLHFGRLPENISDDELNEYLTTLALSSKSPSRSSFKHMVYGLRYYFRHIGQNKRAIALPSLKNEHKLPIILNQSELKKLFCTPKLLKHRIMLALIYSAGLRSQEFSKLKIADIDFERKTIHIRQSKYKKDRIVPLSNYIAKGLKKYMAVEHPHIWFFNGKGPQARYSSSGIGWVMRQALKDSGIVKKVNLHSLRHSYATHLLEDGVNIVVIKGLLGHSTIATTMIYLHVAQLPHTPPHSPLDTLYPGQK